MTNLIVTLGLATTLVLFWLTDRDGPDGAA